MPTLSSTPDYGHHRLRGNFGYDGNPWHGAGTDGPSADCRAETAPVSTTRRCDALGVWPGWGEWQTPCSPRPICWGSGAGRACLGAGVPGAGARGMRRAFGHPQRGDRASVFSWPHFTYTASSPAFLPASQSQMPPQYILPLLHMYRPER